MTNKIRIDVAPVGLSLGSARLVMVAIIAAATFSGCRDSQTAVAPGATLAPQSVTDDSEAIHAQDAHMIKVEITVCAPVKKLLPDDTRGLPHQKFLLALSNGTTILVAHDTKMAPHVPLDAGDRPVIHGEYIWNPRGGIIHWTHHTDTPRHEGGWILFNGVKYE